VLVLRGIILTDRRYFRELLTGSLEVVASNILADRMKRLVATDMLRDDAGQGQRVRNTSEAGVEALPLIYSLGCWGLDWRRGTPSCGLSRS
jgi:hypothetical protein